MTEIISLDDTPPPTPPPPPSPKRPRTPKNNRSETLSLKRARRIEDAFSRNESRSPHNPHVTILVPPSLISVSSPDILHHIRLAYQKEQIQAHDGLKGLIRYKLRGRDGGICLVLYSGEEFLDIARRGRLDDHAKLVLGLCAGEVAVQVVFIVCGVDTVLIRQNRRFVDEITRHGQSSIPSVFSRQALQDMYAHLFLEHHIRCLCTNTHDETASLLRDITDTVGLPPASPNDHWLDSLVRYRRKRTPHTTAVVDTEKDPFADTLSGALRMERAGDDGFAYMAMLSIIPGVSADKARAIREVYPSMSTLLNAYDSCGVWEEKKKLLEDVICGSNGRRMGPSLSAVIAEVLNGDDPKAPINTNR